jgi:hypothetical protein
MAGSPGVYPFAEVPPLLTCATFAPREDFEQSSRGVSTVWLSCGDFRRFFEIPRASALKPITAPRANPVQTLLCWITARGPTGMI